MATFLEAAKLRKAAAAAALEQQKDASQDPFEATQVDPETKPPAPPGPHHSRFKIHGGMLVLAA